MTHANSRTQQLDLLLRATCLARTRVPYRRARRRWSTFVWPRPRRFGCGDVHQAFYGEANRRRLPSFSPPLPASYLRWPRPLTPPRS